MVKCMLKAKEIGIREALELRDDARRDKQPDYDFRCTVCGQSVRAHKGSATGAAHFEHFKRNEACLQSDPLRP